MRQLPKAALFFTALLASGFLASCGSRTLERPSATSPRPPEGRQPAETFTLPAGAERNSLKPATGQGTAIPTITITPPPNKQQPGITPTLPLIDEPETPEPATQPATTAPTRPARRWTITPLPSAEPTAATIKPDTSSTSTSAPRAGPVVDVKFRSGVDLTTPRDALPPAVRDVVDRISPLSTLSPQALEELGAEQFKRWFRITLKPGADPVAFLAAVRASPGVESAELAPSAAPPP